MAQKKRYIRASEIGNYIYCHRSWWLQQVHGEKSRNVRELAAGTEFHEAHGRALTLADRVRRAAYTLLVLGGLILLYWVLNGG